MQNSDFTGVKQVYYIFGANTDVGKSLTSAGLSKACGSDVHYIKPWQTGPLENSDASFVRKISNGAAECKTILHLKLGVSPHRAALHEELTLSDSEVLLQLKTLLEERTTRGVTFIEGAGGVASPTPEGETQCSAFRKIRAPVILVADSKLGGISVTLSSFQLLKAHGFDVWAVLGLEGQDENNRFLQSYFAKQGELTKVFTLPNLDISNLDTSILDTSILDTSILNWFSLSEKIFSEVSQYLEFRFDAEREEYLGLYSRASKALWWPFTQHQQVQADSSNANRTPIVSAFQDDVCFFQQPAAFDANASWWTQCLGHGNNRLAQVAAYTAARYGHVLFPEQAHKPAVELAELLLNEVGKTWASRVFYSDNGSTSVEVALKMAFRAYSRRKNIPCNTKVNLEVLGLKDSYHGDTMGAMDASSANAFNALEPWYSGKGHWFEFPWVQYTVSGCHIVARTEFAEFFNQSNGSNSVNFHNDNEKQAKNAHNILHKFNSLEELFACEREDSHLYSQYKTFLAQNLEKLHQDGRTFGALIIEPVVHGSSGMHMVDPAFQRALVAVAKGSGIPVIYDEVFCGLYRLGFQSATEVLHSAPDVACYSKCLTGGLLPLGVTLASGELFEGFFGESKLQALLHGHSYTAYPVGCAVALEAMQTLLTIGKSFQQTDTLRSGTDLQPFSLFQSAQVNSLSAYSRVTRYWALGSVLAVELSAGLEKAGYGSSVAAMVTKKLAQVGVFARPLGNVVYFIVNLTTDRNTIINLLEKLHAVLVEFEASPMQ